MKYVIFSNDYKKIRNTVTHSKGIIKYFMLQEVKGAKKIRNYLKTLPNCLQINRNEVFGKKREKFITDYVEFIAHLNKDNHSFCWWGLNFPNKYPLFSPLAEKVLLYLTIVDLINEEEFEFFLIVSDDVDILKQLKELKTDLRIKNRIKKQVKIGTLINKYIPLYIILAFMRALLLRFIERRLVSFSFNPETKYCVIRTLINHQSFDKDGCFKGTYFGKFNNYLNQQGLECLIFAAIGRPYITNLKKIRDQRPELNIVPLEYYLSLKELLKCLIQSLNRYIVCFKIKIHSKINEIDIKYLIKKELMHDCKTHRFFANLLVYYCTESLSQKFSIQRFFYPFENRSWEILSIYALRKVKDAAKLVGYQHSSITPMHLNFMLGEGENTIIPLPDLIVTVGEKTKDIMEKRGGFPNGILRTGCALRQKDKKEAGLYDRKRAKIKNILVALASNLNEHVKALIFLNKTFSSCDSFDIYVRPHPRFSIDEAIRLASPLDFKFKIDDRPLVNSLSWVNLVIYISSTVGLEALSLGIPVIYIDLGDFLKPDPLFDYSGLRWSVDTPEELVPTIDSIDNLSDGSFRDLQLKAKEYSRRYFYPVTGKNLKQFINE